MQTQPEAPCGRALQPAARRTAFGLSIEVEPGIDVPGIANTSTLVSGLTTHVRLDPAELERRWSAAAHNAERVRELGDGESVLLTVDLAAPAGYLLRAPGFARILIALDGTEVLCDPEQGSLEWGTLLPAQALPLAATLKGLEVLHASGVLLDGRALLFTGPAGAGKSSLAAAMLRMEAELREHATAALAGMGIPNDSVILYESAIKADKFVLLATGTTSEAQRAYAVLVKHGGQARVHAA